jgi:hypothetical protein
LRRVAAHYHYLLQSNRYLEKVLALHRYYIWANRLRQHFDSAVSNQASTERSDEFFVNDCGIFLSHWYAALFVVVEGWQEIQLSDPKIDTLLSSSNIELLRRFRNGVCHYQKNYHDPRFLDLWQAQDIVPWVKQLNYEFGRYFLQRLTPSPGFES